MAGRPTIRTCAVLFDMDGLLVDSEPLWLEAETAVMARLGADWTTADQVQLLGGSLDRTVRYLLAKATKPAPPETVGRVADGRHRRAGPRRRRAASAGRPRAAGRGARRPACRARW